MVLFEHLICGPILSPGGHNVPFDVESFASQTKKSLIKMSGEILGEFKIGKTLGQGSSSKVKLVTHIPTKQNVIHSDNRWP